MAQYTALANKISKKSKERKAALDEKKATPVIQILKHRDLAKRIAELTEDLEELRTEKAMLLRHMLLRSRSIASAIAGTVFLTACISILTVVFNSRNRALSALI